MKKTLAVTVERGMVARNLINSVFFEKLKEDFCGPGGNFKPATRAGKMWSRNGFTVSTRTVAGIKSPTMIGIGRGGRTKDKIKNNEKEVTHQLIFEDGKIENIKMLGKNSLYVFFVTKNEKEVKIAPIDGNIKLITNLKKN